MDLKQKTIRVCTLIILRSFIFDILREIEKKNRNKKKLIMPFQSNRMYLKEGFEMMNDVEKKGATK